MSENSYKNIFKTTFLFGFVQVFNIIVKIILNKIVAILLGSQGIGTIGIFNTAINLLKTGGGLGISQSAVRDISEANSQNDINRFSRTISIVNKIVIYTSLFGVIITIILSPILSRWTFGNKTYIISYIGIAMVVGISIITEGQLTILKGMRELRYLAKASMIGALSGLVSAIPFYYFLGMNGIVPSLIVTAFGSLFFSNFYVKKITYHPTNIPRNLLFKESKPMITMGISLMFVTFVGFLSDLIISSYINKNGGIDAVGYYQSGITIISGYFGIILTAMTTDYYPRISAIYNDNRMLTQEVNKQSEVGLVLAFPLVVIFLFLSPYIISILYSSKFIETIQYTDFAVLGMIIIICSNNMGMILLAKQKSNIFLITATVQRIISVLISIVLYNNFGILGLGVSYLIMGIIHFLLMSVVMQYFFNIRFNKTLLMQLFMIIIVSIISLFAKKIDYLLVRYSIGGILLFISVLYSYYFLVKKMEFNIKKLIFLIKRK